MQVKANNTEAYQLLHLGTLALARAERAGIRVDMTRADEERDKMTSSIHEVEERLKKTNFYRHWSHSIGGKTPNIYSGKQLAHYLYKTRRLTPSADTASGGQGSTDEEALLQLGIPELADVIKLRKYKKVRDTYLEAFLREQVDGYIHPSFNLHLVRTFRSSSDRPNFQNIPKRDKEAMLLCRGALYPREGHQLLEMDFSGAEIRIAACYHKDPTMLRYIKDPISDMHADLAKQIFKVPDFNKKIPEHYVLRQASKNGFIFPQFYGSYYKNCAKNMACTWGKLPEKEHWKKEQGIAMPEGKTLGAHLIENGFSSLDAFSEHVRKIEQDFWYRRFPIYSEWKEKWWKMYQRKGYFDTLTGFRCSGVMSQKEAINYPVQGSSFHCLLWALIQTDVRMQKEKWDTRIVGQIHDSIILDVLPSEKEHVVETVHKIVTVELPEHWTWINVPMDIEAEITGIDQPWSKLEALKLS